MILWTATAWGVPLNFEANQGQTASPVKFLPTVNVSRNREVQRRIRVVGVMLHVEALDARLR